MSMFLPSKVQQNLYWNQYTMMLFFIYTLILLFAFSVAIIALKKGQIRERIVFLAICLVSVPFLYMFERANIIFLSLILSLVFFVLKDSKKKYLRQIAFISLAIAAGIKIYPAIFGFTLLKEKRYKDSLRLVIYGILSFALPLLFYGWNGATNLVNNLVSATSYFGQSRVGMKLAFSETIKYICDLLGIQQNKEIIINILLLVIVLGSILAFFKFKGKWKEILLLTCLLIGIPKISGAYSSIFMVIPLIILLDSKEKGVKEYIYLGLIMITMLPLPFIFTEGINKPMYSSMYRTIANNAESFSILFMTIGLICEGCHAWFTEKKVKYRKCIFACIGLVTIIYSVFTINKYSNHAYLANSFNRFVANDSFSLDGENECSQLFIAKDDVISYMMIRLGKVECENFILELTKVESDEIILSKTINKEMLRDNSMNGIFLDNVATESGKMYKITIRNIIGGNQTMKVYKTVDSYITEDEYSLYNQEPQNFSLAINIYAK